mmetsp:Transcript_333/g.893  ORF Transcript_333/g.893 Transcript_333/m.893 type:complete len:217 (-) Transcript_333:869-1519(-)
MYPDVKRAVLLKRLQESNLSSMLSSLRSAESIGLRFLLLPHCASCALVICPCRRVMVLPAILPLAFSRNESCFSISAIRIAAAANVALFSFSFLASSAHLLFMLCWILAAALPASDASTLGVPLLPSRLMVKMVLVRAVNVNCLDLVFVSPFLMCSSTIISTSSESPHNLLPMASIARPMCLTLCPTWSIFCPVPAQSSISVFVAVLALRNSSIRR